MLEFGKFNVLCQESARTTWERAVTEATAAGIAIPVIVHFVPQWEHAMNNIAWEIPLACLASIGATRLLLSPFLIYRKRDSEASKAEVALKNARTPKVRSYRDCPALSGDFLVGSTSPPETRQCRASRRVVFTQSGGEKAY